MVRFLCTLPCELMKTTRTHILLPEDLVREIDVITGPRGRSAFLAETAREAVRRKKLLQFQESDLQAWNDADHPEFAQGAAAWVGGLRQGMNSDRRKKKRRRAQR